MALMKFEFFSQVLGIATEINVVFSQQSKTEFGKDHRSPVLYLLHGLSDNQNGWIRKSSIERYVEEYDVTVVMPSAHRSFYRNTYSGYRYFDYVAEELPEICQRYLQISEDPAKCFVAGLSMGGYGAFKLALSKPDNYAAAASMSGALDLQALSADRDEAYPEWPHIFGPSGSISGTEDDLLHLATQLTNRLGSVPKLYQCCGTEDYLYPVNQSFLEMGKSCGLKIHYEEGPGEHNWHYWDKQIQRVLEWLPLLRLGNLGPE